MAKVPDIAQRISRVVGEKLTAEQVASVLAAWNDVQTGEPVGTVKLNPDTGDLAYRVTVNGLDTWAVISTEGLLSYNTESTLPWTELTGAADA